jgi:hypothetical protein
LVLLYEARRHEEYLQHEAKKHSQIQWSPPHEGHLLQLPKTTQTPSEVAVADCGMVLAQAQILQNLPAAASGICHHPRDLLLGQSRAPMVHIHWSAAGLTPWHASGQWVLHAAIHRPRAAIPTSLFPQMLLLPTVASSLHVLFSEQTCAMISSEILSAVVTF